MENSGMPTSTVCTPSRVAVSGPMVEPHGTVLWDTNSWVATPARRQARRHKRCPPGRLLARRSRVDLQQRTAVEQGGSPDHAVPGSWGAPRVPCRPTSRHCSPESAHVDHRRRRGPRSADHVGRSGPGLTGTRCRSLHDRRRPARNSLPSRDIDQRRQAGVHTDQVVQPPRGETPPTLRRSPVARLSKIVRSKARTSPAACPPARLDDQERFLLDHPRPERCRVPLPVELEALVVHCPIEVERQLGIRAMAPLCTSVTPPSVTNRPATPSSRSSRS